MKLPSIPTGLPVITSIQQLRKLAEDNDSTLEGVVVENLTLKGEDITGLDFDTVHFIHSHLKQCELSGTHFRDVMVEGCDWSNSRLEGSDWSCCLWKDSKAVGADFHGTRFWNMSFENCLLQYANFGACGFKGAELQACDLSEAFLNECKLKDFKLSGTALTGATLFHTPLGGLDLSTCKLEALVLSEHGEELKGAVVDLYQAAQLARRLGIVIKE